MVHSVTRTSEYGWDIIIATLGECGIDDGRKWVPDSNYLLITTKSRRKMVCKTMGNAVFVSTCVPCHNETQPNLKVWKNVLPECSKFSAQIDMVLRFRENFCLTFPHNLLWCSKLHFFSGRLYQDVSTSCWATQVYNCMPIKLKKEIFTLVIRIVPWTALIQQFTMST